MTIEILYFDGCPNSRLARELVREVLESEHVRAYLQLVEIRDAGDAVARRFLGSPTIRVNGRDIEPEARLRTDYGYMCRTYRAGSGTAGVPRSEQIRRAVREAARSSAGRSAG